MSITARRQITVEVPHSEWNPGTSTVRLAAGVGLWNAATDSYLLPGADGERHAARRRRRRPRPRPPSSTSPSASTTRSRCRATPERRQRRSTPPTGASPRRRRRSPRGDISPFHAEVDFAKLKAKTNDDMPGAAHRRAPDRASSTASSPRTSPTGRAPTTRPAAAAASAECIGAMRGQLLPYAIYVPSGAAPSAGWGLTLLLHSLSANYNQFAGTQQPVAVRRPRAGLDRDHALGARARRLVLRPRRRRHLRSVGRRRRALPARSRASPTSPATRWAATAPTSSRPSSPTCSRAPSRPSARPALGRVGRRPPNRPAANSRSPQRMLGSVRNVPFLIWDETTDELVPIAGVLEQVETLRRARLPLRIRPVPGGRAPDARDQRRIRSPPPTSSGPKRSTATPRTSPTSTTRRWTSPPTARAPATPTGSTA